MVNEVITHSINCLKCGGGLLGLPKNEAILMNNNGKVTGEHKVCPVFPKLRK
jgi:hypothetical protein